MIHLLERVAGVRSTPTHTYVVAQTTPRKPVRLAGLDLAKGVLVLVMVVYHWMNYFIGLDSALYKYLRFLTPSFIFVTGFLISNVYLARFAAGERGIPARLIQRGLKLLGIVLVLNGAASILGTGTIAARLADQSLGGLAWAYLAGFAPVSFSVLVPIAYLLISAAGLLIMSRHFHGLFHLLSAALIVAALVFEWKGFQSGYLDLLSVGMLGVSVGHIPIAGVNRIVQRRAMILVAYVAYLWAITVWNAVYALQVAGVCLSLAVLYRPGGVVQDNMLQRVLIRLGEYSLFAYIAQIVILRSGTHVFGAGTESAYAALFVGIGGTILSVEAVDRYKHRVAGLNRLYAAVFT